MSGLMTTRQSLTVNIHFCTIGMTMDTEEVQAKEVVEVWGIKVTGRFPINNN